MLTRKPPKMLAALWTPLQSPITVASLGTPEKKSVQTIKTRAIPGIFRRKHTVDLAYGVLDLAATLRWSSELPRQQHGIGTVPNSTWPDCQSHAVPKNLDLALAIKSN